MTAPIWPVAAWPKRLPIIRHLRAALLLHKINSHYALMIECGFLGGWSDIELGWLEAVKRGDA